MVPDLFLFWRATLDTETETNNVYPFVEVLKSGEDWQVQDGFPDTDKVRKILSVPLDDTELAHNVRIRQLGEAAWTPTNKGPVKSKADVVDAVEALRLNHKLLKAGVKISEGFVPKKVLDAEIEHCIGTNNLRQLVLKAVQNGGTKPYFGVMKTLRETRGKTCKDAYKILELFTGQMGVTKLTWNDTVHLSERLEYLIGRIAAKKKAPVVDGEEDENVEKYLEQAMEQGLAVYADILGGDPKYTGAKLKWGDMRIDTPPMGEQILNRNATVSRHPAEEGTYIRQPWRIHTDRMIFRRDRKKRGGSVLIDTSGSMSLDPSQILDMVMSAPALVVAVYAGDSTSGVLRIVVKNSRKVDDSLIRCPSAGNNTIDGPALRDWLAKQPQPRVWVSDGQVTGVGDQSATNLREEAAVICETNSIIRVNNMEKAKRLFKRIEQSGSKLHPAMRRRKARELLGK